MSEKCKCKAGRCLECGSICQRCGCSCDGVPPQRALARKRGRPIKQISTGEGTLIRGDDGMPRLKRSKKRLKPELKTWRDVWAAFGFTKPLCRKFPSRVDRIEGKVHRSSAGWNSMLQRLHAATTRVAQIFYPSKANDLKQDMARKILKKELALAVKPAKELACIIETLTLAMEKSPSNSIQRRTLRAVMVKGLTKATITELKRQGRITLGGAGKDAAYHDFKTLALGKLLEIKRRGRKSQLPTEILSYLDAIVRADPGIKPAVAFKKVTKRFPKSITVPTRVNEIKKRVSTLKQAIKKKNKSIVTTATLVQARDTTQSANL